MRTLRSSVGAFSVLTIMMAGMPGWAKVSSTPSPASDSAIASSAGGSLATRISPVWKAVNRVAASGRKRKIDLIEQRRALVRGKFGRPVVVRVALQDDLGLRVPLHKAERPGAHRVAAVVRAILLQRGRRRDAEPLAGGIAQEGRIGRGELHDGRVVVHHLGLRVLVIDQQRLAARLQHGVADDVVE